MKYYSYTAILFLRISVIYSIINEIHSKYNVIQYIINVENQQKQHGYGHCSLITWTFLCTLKLSEMLATPYT